MGVEQAFIVGNKVLDPFEEGVIKEYCDDNGLSLLILIPYDEEIRKNDVKGEALALSKASSGLNAIKTLSERLLSTSLE
jgi:CO dehydrogenase nickel-insertion accessory protein CooC1